MKITLLQTDIQWLDTAQNIERATQLLDQAKGSDLYVLPEMWATGFNTSPSYEMIAQGEEALAWMHKQAKRRNCAVAGTLAVRNWSEEEVPQHTALWRNRFFFVTPDGEHFYDKRNLFFYGGEDLTYTAGTERKIVTWRGVRFMLQTCFDLRFPETARNHLATAYDILLYVANWPASRRNAWESLLVARAIENQAFCIGVNRTGSDPQCVYHGGSLAVDAYGHTQLQLGEREQAATVEVDLEKQRAFREKFHVLR